jgi:hypothetical protein
MNMIIAVIIFVVGSSIQAGAVSIGMLFVGKSESIKWFGAIR